VSEAALTYPEDHWCPRCGLHLRSQDNYSGVHILQPLCPVCVDDDRRILGSALEGGRSVLLELASNQEDQDG